MQTMFRLAAALDFPVAANVVKLTVENKKARVECETEDGARDLYEMETPCVIGAGGFGHNPGQQACAASNRQIAGTGK